MLGDGLPMGSILVVDDDDGVRRFLSKALIRLGYEVETASDGELAIQHLKRRSYDLVITDLKMPDLDGRDLLATIQEAGVDTDVLMMSGAGTIPEAVEAIRMGAKNFLEKPLDLTDLKREVRAIFKARSEGQTISPSHPAAQPPQPTSDADHIGRYELKKQIGAGGMGEVFEAFDRGEASSWSAFSGRAGSPAACITRTSSRPTISAKTTIESVSTW
jgi:DNA-binding NtrC family response regulator